MESDPDPNAVLAGRLFGVIGRFRRQMRRSTTREFDVSGLTQSQVELVRLVGRQPGISVREAAMELALVPNSASTLVSKLVGDGYLVRTVDPDDRRVGRLQLTEPAQRIADESRAARREALAVVLDELDSRDRDDLARGLEVLSRMTRMLQQEEAQ